jgi:integrase
MPRVFRQQYTRPIPPDAERVTLERKGKKVPSVRFKGPDGKTVTAPLTKKGDRCRLPSPTWYGRVNGQPVPLCTNKTAAELMLAELIRKAELGKVGATDPFEGHRKRPLAEHLADYRRELEARGNTPRYTDLVVSRLEDLLAGCGFVFTPDLSASRVMEWLDGLRRQGRRPAELDPGKQEWTRRELGQLLGIKPASVPPLVRRHRLQASGKGKARRYPRVTVLALQDRQCQGVSVETTNQYLTHLKSFCKWLAKDGRMGENPVERLEAGNAEVDRRHDRRELDAGELRRLLAAARDSARTFRGLTGWDRYHLYAAACGTGFRASGLAGLTPESFGLDPAGPTVTLAARRNKSRKLKAQPLPADVADLLREYLRDKPAGQPVWPGTWASDRVAADMLRLDLAAAGIPYVVDGPDGPLHADFHALRHSYLTLGGRAGIDLRTLQELAGHSTSALTERYSHRRLHDLAGAVEKLPRLLPDDAIAGERVALHATGTDGAGPESADKNTPLSADAYTPLTQLPDGGRERLRLLETPAGGNAENATDRNPLAVQGVEAGCDRVRAVDSRAGDRIRTGDVQLGKRNNPSAEKHRNPLRFSILRRSGAVCKHVRAVSSACEKPRKFRSCRRFCGHSAEEQLKEWERSARPRPALPPPRAAFPRLPVARAAGRWSGSVMAHRPPAAASPRRRHRLPLLVVAEPRARAVHAVQAQVRGQGGPDQRGLFLGERA